ncbi:MAG: bifunctional pyr operon transcriptional regulator/uracil phosphoribosyltransferase [Legionellales bacterium]|nr:bifunctional pyr operon transcriptional regulator/uracil phosphoribosyltransferase [Legionellales bacterium]|tara:strand:- start:5683 stop:6216 length:534 start_codon:yes stop_codon:yes gene_type:complete
MSDEIYVKQLISEMVTAIKSHTSANNYYAPLMIGVKTGGAWVANLLHRQLKYKEPPGELNISFYRDDFSTLGMHPEVSPSQLCIDVNDRHIILVDDVLYTGRTIRAAMNEIFDYGRPASITLVVLVDRSSNRELPIQADIIGKSIALDAEEHVKLHGPEPLMLSITNIESAGTKKMG